MSVPGRIPCPDHHAAWTAGRNLVAALAVVTLMVFLTFRILGAIDRNEAQSAVERAELRAMILRVEERITAHDAHQVEVIRRLDAIEAAIREVQGKNRP